MHDEMRTRRTVGWYSTRVVGITLTIATMAMNAHAQQVRQRGLCWISADQGCSTIVLTETGAAFNLARARRIIEPVSDSANFTREEFSAAEAYMHWQLGLMAKVAPRWSAGAAWQLRTASEADGYTWLYARGRYWLAPKRSLDFAIGKPGVTAWRGGVGIAAGVNLHDRLLVNLSYDDVRWRSSLYSNEFERYRDNRTRKRSLQVNGELGALPGGIGMGVSALGVVVLSILFLGYVD